MLSKLSIHPVPYTVSKFTFIWIHPFVDVYDIFDFDTMHVLSLWISPRLEECFGSYLGDNNEKTPSIRLRCVSYKSYKQLGKEVLRCLNEFFLLTATSSSQIKKDFDFSRKPNGSGSPGLFTKCGSIVMLQTKKFKNIYKISPLLSAIVDFCCGQSNCADRTRTFTKYADLARTLRNENVRKWCTKSDFQMFTEMITDIKNFGCKIFGKYQPSEIKTQKRHALNHLPEYIAGTSAAEYFHLGLYESAHKDFKQMCQQSSKKNCTLVDKIIGKPSLRSTMKDNEHDHKETSRRCSQSELLALCTNGAYLVRNVMNIMLRDL